ncbi:MAG: MOSC N-terminal beta barrel domain-containing protein [Ktedonobacteraceae bacterium]|nr:MOSC N-terminal beta barrel domain-containing protein [Ktedonobacteraceae bacterium]
MTSISALYIYPIKSCGGIAQSQLCLTACGPQGDRDFMLVNKQGKFLSQREFPQLALVQPYVNGKLLTLKAPRMPELTIDIYFIGKASRVSIWNDVCNAVDQSDAAAQWFSTYLRTDCRLVRMAEGCIRFVDPQYAQRPTDQVSFVDGYPLLLVSKDSVNDLNKRLLTPISVMRFRPNVVITGSLAYAEDSWKHIRLGKVDLDIAKPCGRCVIVNVNPSTASTSKEPLKTLTSYRLRNGKAIFGQNLIHRTNGQLHLGDSLEVLAQEKIG